MERPLLHDGPVRSSTSAVLATLLLTHASGCVTFGLANARAPGTSPTASLPAALCFEPVSCLGLLGLAALLAATGDAARSAENPYAGPAEEGAPIDSCPSPRTCAYLTEAQCEDLPSGCHCQCGVSRAAGRLPAPRADPVVADRHGWPH